MVDLEDGTRLTDMGSLRALAGVESAELAGNRLSVWLKDLSDGTAGVLGWLAAGGQRFGHVASEAPSLETVFLTLTGRSLRDS